MFLFFLFVFTFIFKFNAGTLIVISIVFETGKSLSQIIKKE